MFPYPQNNPMARPRSPEGTLKDRVVTLRLAAPEASALDWLVALQNQRLRELRVPAVVGPSDVLRAALLAEAEARGAPGYELALSPAGPSPVVTADNTNTTSTADPAPSPGPKTSAAARTVPLALAPPPAEATPPLPASSKASTPKGSAAKARRSSTTSDDALDPDRVRARLNAHLHDSGTSQKAFAERAGVAQSQVSGFLAARVMPSEEKLAAIAAALPKATR